MMVSSWILEETDMFAVDVVPEGGEQEEEGGTVENC